MRCLRVLLLLAVSVLVFVSQSLGQAPAGAPRITGPVDEKSLVTLPGNIHPYARAEYDRGPVSSDLPMTDLILVLRRSPGQQKAFDNFVASQYDPASPDFHRWLKPEEIANRFGPSSADVATISAWLTSHGLSVDEVSKDRMSIRFSGHAGQVQETFHTQIHNLSVRNQAHIANMTDPQIPAALAPVIVGVKALHNFFAHPLSRIGSPVKLNTATGKWERTPLPASFPKSVAGSFAPRPEFGTTGGSGSSTFQIEDVAPYDFATIYNVLPLWTASTPIDGTGQTIAIAATSSITPSDVDTFRSAFGLPAYASGDLTITSGNGTTPTICTSTSTTATCTVTDQIENTLDVEWAGAIAKGAKIILVTSASKSASDDALFDSESYIVNNAAAPVMNVSYGFCELFMGTAGNTEYNNLWQTAASGGISVFVATGDAGSPACDQGGDASGTPYVAEFGLAVNGFASTPYNTAVGGTDFNWGTTASPYWNASNAANGSSAIGYIPETTWNNSCTNSALLTFFQNAAKGISVTQPTDAESACNFAANNYKAVQSKFGVDISAFVDTAGAGGGVSACTTSDSSTPASCAGGYAKPSWQTGVTGIPADGKRDIPDVSFFASNGFSGSAYLICVTAGGVKCSYSSTTEPVSPLEIGGTSVASPAMAGVMALINQQAGSPQGNPNQQLYTMAAAETYSACNSSSSPASTCSFNDITSGTISMPCNAGFVSTSPNSPDCTPVHSGDKVGILSGDNVTTGYDVATGLGSLNVANVVNNWSAGIGTGTPTVTVTPSTMTPWSSAAFTVGVTVSGSASTIAPVGTVTLSSSAGSYTSAVETLSNGKFTFTIPAGSLPVGSATLTANYSGDTAYAATPGSVTVTVNQSPFQLAATTPISLTAGAGTGNASTVTVTPSGNYTGTVTLSATITSSPSGTVTAPPTFAISPSTLTFTSSSNAAQTAQVTVATTPAPSFVHSVGSHHAAWFRSAAGTALAALFFFFLPLGSRRGRRYFSVLLLIVAASLTAVGCGGGGGGGGSQKTTPSVTVSPTKSTIATTDSLSVAISVSGGSATATGSVTLTSGTGTGAYSSGATNLSSGAATINIPANSLPLGSDTLTASYSGDTNYNAGTGTAPVKVGNPGTTPGNYTITVTGTDAAGSMATTTFTLTVN